MAALAGVPQPLGTKPRDRLAAAEFVADKLPNTQSRLDPSVQLSRTDGGLVGRVAADTLAGAALGSTRPGRRAVAEGAAFAAAGALLGNYLGYHTRKAVVETTGLPNPVVAVVAVVGRGHTAQRMARTS